MYKRALLFLLSACTIATGASRIQEAEIAAGDISTGRTVLPTNTSSSLKDVLTSVDTQLATLTDINANFTNYPRTILHAVLTNSVVCAGGGVYTTIGSWSNTSQHAYSLDVTNCFTAPFDGLYVFSMDTYGSVPGTSTNGALMVGFADINTNMYFSSTVGLRNLTANNYSTTVTGCRKLGVGVKVRPMVLNNSLASGNYTNQTSNILIQYMGN